MSISSLTTPSPNLPCHTYCLTLSVNAFRTIQEVAICINHIPHPRHGSHRR